MLVESRLGEIFQYIEFETMTRYLDGNVWQIVKSHMAKV